MRKVAKLFALAGILIGLRRGEPPALCRLRTGLRGDAALEERRGEREVVDDVETERRRGSAILTTCSAFAAPLAGSSREGRLSFFVVGGGRQASFR